MGPSLARLRASAVTTVALTLLLTSLASCTVEHAVAPGPAEQAEADLLAELQPDTARLLPEAPISGRIGPSAVWTGQEAIIWGGSDLIRSAEEPRSDGAAFDPSTDAWRLLPQAPIEGRAYAATIWTGSEMVVWGGSQNGRFMGDGAAYDPRTNEWRIIAGSPLEPAVKSATTWTGTEMVVIGGLNRDGSSAAYEPATDRWREMADAPGQVSPPYPQAVWTGQAVLTTIMGRGGNPGLSQLAMYRPDRDTWEIVDEQFPSPWLVSVPGVDLGLIGDEAVALTTSPNAAIPVLSVSGETGRTLRPNPADLMPIGLSQPIWSGREILMWSGGATGLALDPLSERWREFPAGDVTSRTDGAMVWADGVLIAWGGFVSNRDGTASAARDGIMYRPRP